MAHELAIIGAGNMAEAIARSVIASNVLQKNQIIAADVSPARREIFSRQTGVEAIEKNGQAARGAKMLMAGRDRP